VNLVTIALDGGRPDLALAHGEQLRAVASRMMGGSEDILASALESLVRAARGQQAPGELEQAVAALRAADAKAMLAYTLNTMADMALGAGDLDTARRHAGEALELATLVQRASLIATARAMRGRIALAQGDRRAAQQELDAMKTARAEPLALPAHAHARLDQLESLLENEAPVRRRRSTPTRTPPQ
jgi:ATP/maltotriose-dependent transcriptional regulator MalT